MTRGSCWISFLLFVSWPGLASSQERQPSAEARGILPKEEIQAWHFLEQHPASDGRDVVVAIFDTGVDPGAAGLAETTTGKPKVIDLIDGTGSGDVDTTTIRKPRENQLIGLSGRQLKLDPKWTRHTSEFHVGLKAAYTLFPAELVARLKIKRRKAFDQRQRRIELALRQQITLSASAEAEAGGSARGVPLDEWKKRLEQLQVAVNAYQDVGPVLDCVVFHDGQNYRAVVDTDEDGDLTDEKALTNYRIERQFATFDDESQLNFAINIYDEGNLLSIVTDCGAHGTHVAGIVSANFPEHPELNGIAPGTQIVSVKIGDTRLGGMETGAGIQRGLLAAVAHKVDLINMSFGEPSRTPDRGYLIKLCSDIARRHGITFVAAAGNHGPALSTGIAPGGTSSALIGAGAYISPAMMDAEYTLPHQAGEMAYEFSSRDPSFDGAMGIDILAPGGAIAPVPRWTLNRKQQMNGTSMAAPNACGGLALLISAMKQRGLRYSSESLRRAIQHTAREVSLTDAFTAGSGLMQVDKALDFLLHHADDPQQHLAFEIKVTTRENARGIYLRSARECRRVSSQRIQVKPVFPPETSNDERLKLEMPLRLESTAAWVSVGEKMMMYSGGNTFRLSVDPTDLPPGVHHAQVKAQVQPLLPTNPSTEPGRLAANGAAPVAATLGSSESSRTASGGYVAFRVPITVVVPDPCGSATNYCWQKTLELSPGATRRSFITVPEGATWMDLRLTRGDEQGDRLVVVHAVQLLPGLTYREAQMHSYERMQAGATVRKTMPVTGGETLELCLLQHWATSGETRLDVELSFGGVNPDQQLISLVGVRPSPPVRIRSLIEQTIQPTAQLKTRRSTMRPKSWRMVPPTARDRVADGPAFYRLKLDYTFQQSHAGKLTIRFPAGDRMLYDSVVGGHVWQLFDAHGRLAGTDDVWPEALHVAQGSHTVEVILRHEDPQVLKRYRQSPLMIDRDLSPSIGVPAYRSELDAITRSNPVGQLPVFARDPLRLHFALPRDFKPPEHVEPGDLLLGEVTYGATDASRAGAEKKPGGFPVQWHPAGSRPVTKNTGGQTDALSKPSDLTERLVDYQLRLLQALPHDASAELFEKLAAMVSAARPDEIGVWVARLHRLDHESHRKEHLGEVVAAADHVISQIDPAELAKKLGRRSFATDETQPQQKKILVDALYRKGRALGYMELPDVIERFPIADREKHDKQFADTFKALSSWVDTTDREYFLLHVRKLRRAGKPGEALGLLNRYLSTLDPNYWHFKKRRDLYLELGWDHLYENASRDLLIRFPKRR